MRERWLDLSPDGAHDVAAGLIRDGQLEMALARLESMEHQRMRIEHWLWDMMIYMLLDREEIDEALKIIKRRFQNDDRNVTPNMWFYLMEIASRCLHVCLPPVDYADELPSG